MGYRRGLVAYLGLQCKPTSRRICARSVYVKNFRKLTIIRHGFEGLRRLSNTLLYDRHKFFYIAIGLHR